jgi:hypothetical protein
MSFNNKSPRFYEQHKNCNQSKYQENNNPLTLTNQKPQKVVHNNVFAINTAKENKKTKNSHFIKTDLLKGIQKNKNAVLYKSVLDSLQCEIGKHHNLKKLIRAWKQTAIIYEDFIPLSYRGLSLVDLILLSLLLATTKRVKEEHFAQTKTKNDDPPSFLENYNVFERLVLLSTTETFFLCILITKLLLDLDEYDDMVLTGSIFTVEFLSSLFSNYNTLTKKKTTQSNKTSKDNHYGQYKNKISKEKRKIMLQAIFSLQLYAMDIGKPFGYLKHDTFLNVDSKIVFYVTNIIQRPLQNEDFEHLPIHDILLCDI